MDVRRVVPNLTVPDLAASSARWQQVTGMREVMDHGWIVTLAGPGGAQLSLMTSDATAPVNPALSVEVDDVDQALATATSLGLEIVHPLTTEPWGVRRFFYRDPDGVVVNVLAHG